jgi:serine/threonine-protein kinase
VTVGEVLDRGSARIELQLEGQSLVQARLLNTMSRVYVNLGDYDTAEELARRGLDLRRDLLGERHAEVADSLEQLGSTLFRAGRGSESLRNLEEALEIRLAVLGPDHEDTARSFYFLGVPNAAMGEYDRAEQYLQRALPLLEDTLGPESKLVAWCHNDLGALRFVQERYAEALPHLEQALELKRELLGPDHPDVFIGLNNIGYVHAKLGNFAKSESYEGRHEEALRHFREALAIQESEGAQALHGLAHTLEFIGKTLRDMGDAPGAVVALRRSLELREEQLGADDPALAPLLELLAATLDEAGEQAEAERLRTRLRQSTLAG